MYELLIQSFLGWPAMILSVFFALAGIFRKKTGLALVSAVLFLAPAWYLSHYSSVLGSLPFFFLLSAQAISKRRIFFAFVAIMPVLLVMGILGYIVLSQ